MIGINKTLKIQNESGSKLSFSDFGACLMSWTFKVNDNKVDIVLGYEDEKQYLKNSLYLGSTVGRYANRINRGMFTLNGKKIKLPRNNNDHHLHGGYKGFSSKPWEVSEHSSNRIVFSLISPHFDENYPSLLSTIVAYDINEKNELNINFNAKAQEDTILNLTHHSYFNLNHNVSDNILDHELKIYADKITEINSDLIPTGKFLDVINTPLDFRKGAIIGERIASNFNQIEYGHGYDHNYVINNFDPKVSKIAAELTSHRTGIKMHVKTDLPGIQFYSGNFLDGSFKGKNNQKLKKYSGLCLEPQYFPDSPNHTNFPSTILKKGSNYNHNITYGITF